MNIPQPLQLVIDEFSKLPSIGKKTAQRLAIYLMKSDKEEIDKLIFSLTELKEKLKVCSRCFNVSTDVLCDICKSTKRDLNIVCVVEEISDIIAIERTNEYNGLYHVLGGVLSPLSGRDAESLRIKELLDRIETEKFKEVILAMNPDTEGETTSLYLARLLKPLNLKITRIARGLPVGGDLEFADEATIGRAVLSRITLQ